MENYHTWQTKQPTAPLAGAAGVSQFQQEKGVGPRAIKHLQEQEGGGQPVIANLDMEYDPKYDTHPNEFGRDRTDVHPEDPYSAEIHKGLGKPYSVPGQRDPGANVHLTGGRKKALTAEPDFIWSKNPATVKVEYGNRLGAGHKSDDVFKQLIGEIADHFTAGKISNRDAHRAANEALGRYILSGKKTAWSGWGPEQKQHKVSGWKWDEYQNGFISNAPRQFECSCGEPVKVPDYHDCKCGKIWNTYVIGTGGDKHQAAAEKYIAREIPVRKDVMVASKKKATDHFHSDQGYAGPMKPKENAFPPSEYGANDKCLTCGAHFLEPHIGHDPANNKWGNRLPSQGYPDYDKALNDWEHQDANENAFPSNHHPKVKSTTKGIDAKDWHRRDHTTQQWTNT